MANDEDEGMHDDETSKVDRAIGQRVRLLRKSRTLSQAGLVEKLAGVGYDIGQSYLSDLERGLRRWNTESLCAVARALGVRMAELMPDAEDAPSPDATLTAQVTQEEMAELMLRRTQGLKAAGRYLLDLLRE